MMWKIFGGLLAASVIASSAAAQDVLSGALTESSDTLSSGQYYVGYSFPGNTGDRIEILVEADGFYPALLTIAPGGEQRSTTVAETAGGQPLTILRYTQAIDATGLWTFVVTSRDPGETGTFTITVRSWSRLPGS